MYGNYRMIKILFIYNIYLLAGLYNIMYYYKLYILCDFRWLFHSVLSNKKFRLIANFGMNQFKNNQINTLKFFSSLRFSQFL